MSADSDEEVPRIIYARLENSGARQEKSRAEGLALSAKVVATLGAARDMFDGSRPLSVNHIKGDTGVASMSDISSITQIPPRRHGRWGGPLGWAED